MVDPIERTTAMIALRPGREADSAAALTAMGAELPAMGRFTETAGLLLARSSPDQVLAMRVGTDAPLMAELAPLSPIAGLIDLSDARVAMRVSGPDAIARLAMLVPLDLHHDSFPPGRCAQTIMAHLSVLLLRHAATDFELQCGRSFAESFERAFGSAA